MWFMSAETEAIFQDLPDTLGLMQSCQEVYVDSGTSASCNIIHLTFREYLAAYHVSQQSKDERLVFMWNTFKIRSWKCMVVKFLADFTELGQDLWDSTKRDSFHQTANPLLSFWVPRSFCDH